MKTQKNHKIRTVQATVVVRQATKPAAKRAVETTTAPRRNMVTNLRKRLGLSQQALAERLGVVRQTISKFELAQRDWKNSEVANHVRAMAREAGLR